jgi:hypothetical protein
MVSQQRIGPYQKLMCTVLHVEHFLFVFCSWPSRAHNHFWDMECISACGFVHGSIAFAELSEAEGVTKSTTPSGETEVYTFCVGPRLAAV